jgi:programmed cell death 6-interacting protein
VQLKSAQFNAEACYRAGLDLHDKENIAEEIVRLKAGSHMLLEARRSGKGGVAPLMDAVSKLELNINRNLERAIKENDRVYLMGVPAADSLPPLTGEITALQIATERKHDEIVNTLLSWSYLQLQIWYCIIFRPYGCVCN